jgi:hypothetical protein
VARGEVAVLDGLVAHKGGTTAVVPVIAATAANAPADLFSAVNDVFGTWEVIGPDDAQLDAARAALHLDFGAPVPLRVAVQFPDAADGRQLFGEKVVWLGESRGNPTIGTVTVGGQPPGTDIAVPEDVDVPLAIDADPKSSVSWLTSCGTMHDDNEHAAFVHVLPKDRHQGELAVVVRDPNGGVAWQVWPIHSP